MSQGVAAPDVIKIAHRTIQKARRYLAQLPPQSTPLRAIRRQPHVLSALRVTRLTRATPRLCSHLSLARPQPCVLLVVNLVTLQVPVSHRKTLPLVRLLVPALVRVARIAAPHAAASLLLNQPRLIRLWTISA